MLSFTGSIRVYVALEPADMRKSFNGLSALVSERLGEDPLSGALYIFTNRRRTRLKVLFWDRSGLWCAAKRLERGSFSWPKPARAGERKLSLSPEALAMLTDGIDLRGAKMREWYRREDG